MPGDGTGLGRGAGSGPGDGTGAVGGWWPGAGGERGERGERERESVGGRRGQRAVGRGPKQHGPAGPERCRAGKEGGGMSWPRYGGSSGHLGQAGEREPAPSGVGDSIKSVQLWGDWWLGLPGGKRKKTGRQGPDPGAARYRGYPLPTGDGGGRQVAGRRGPGQIRRRTQGGRVPETTRAGARGRRRVARGGWVVEEEGGKRGWWFTRGVDRGVTALGRQEVGRPGAGGCRE